MESVIKIGGAIGDIAISVRVSSRARFARISVRPDQTVKLTIPKGFPLIYAEKLVKQKALWIWSKLEKFRLPKKRGGSELNIPRASKRQYEQYKEDARALVQKKLHLYNGQYQFTYHRVSIRNQKTRWGSCSHNANLNFNYRVVFLPDHLVDYLIVHELCHLAEFNHSPKFWELVSQTIPNYNNCRKQLRSV